MKLGLIHFRSCVVAVAVAYYQLQIPNAKSYYQHGYGVNEAMYSEDIQGTPAQLKHGAGCGYAN